MALIKLKKLEQYLQELQVFENPKINLEQYATTPHLAACMLHTIQSSFGDIEDQIIADLGCGCGVLSLGAAMLGAAYCVGFDIDQDALDIFQLNKMDFEIENCEAVQYDINSLSDRWNGFFDTVIMNPPFGTRNKGIDIDFIKAALRLSNNVYSLHKTSTREYIIKKSKEFGANCKVIAELRFNLPQTYKFHTKQSVDIEVDLIKINRM